MRRLFECCFLFVLAACNGIKETDIRGNVKLEVHLDKETRSADPQENVINDINLFVFNEYGELEESRYYKNYEQQNLRLLLHKRYSFYVCANIGWKLEIASIEELLQFRYWFAYPDDYRTGIPMCGKLEDFELQDFSKISIDMERIMAKVSVRVDRRNLDSDVRIDIRSIKVGGCPKSVLLFEESNAEGTSDIFASGFSKSEDSVSALNSETAGRVSESVALYILENMQGDLLGSGIKEQEKYFGENDPRCKLCSYIEIKADYYSKSRYGQLKYRFYLGEGNGNFDVRRNCHYIITVAPEGNGLSEDSWRIEKDGLRESTQAISLDRQTLVFSYKGETVCLMASTEPSGTNIPGLVWQSSNPSVASVNSEGKVTAEGEGVCTIFCWADGAEDTGAECEVRSVFIEPYAHFYTESYIECEVGDTIHLGCEYFPPNTECDIGIEDMEYDRERGIYDYIIDEDGHGARLIFRKKGTGLVQYALGPPLDTSENFLMICEP